MVEIIRHMKWNCHFFYILKISFLLSYTRMMYQSYLLLARPLMLQQHGDDQWRIQGG